MINGRPATPGQEVVINQSLPVKELFRPAMRAAAMAFFTLKAHVFSLTFADYPFPIVVFTPGCTTTTGVVRWPDIIK
jgi:hypothetical protein